MSQNSEVDLFLALHHLGENLFQNTEGKIQKKKKIIWARPGFEPGTTRTLSEYHTPRPTSQFILERNVPLYIKPVGFKVI